MGVELSKGARAVVMAVRARSRLSAENLQKFLGGSDPAKSTSDLLAAGDFLTGEDRKVIVGVLKDARQAHRLPELLKAAQGNNSTGEFAFVVLKCHESADPLNTTVLADLAGTDVSAIAVALEVLKLREDARRALQRDVEGDVPSDMPLRDRAMRIARAVRAGAYLKSNMLATVLNGETPDVHLLAMDTLTGPENESVARHLCEHGNIAELMTLALRDERAKTALQSHKNVTALVAEICTWLVHADHDHVQLAADLLQDRRNDVLSAHEVVAPLFTAAAREVPGVLEVLVAHKAPAKILFAVVEAALLSPETSGEAEARRTVALQLVDARKDLADTIAHVLGVPVQPLSETDTQDATKQ